MSHGLSFLSLAASASPAKPATNSDDTSAHLAIDMMSKMLPAPLDRVDEAVVKHRIGWMGEVDVARRVCLVIGGDALGVNNPEAPNPTRVIP